METQENSSTFFVESLNHRVYPDRLRTKHKETAGCLRLPTRIAAPIRNLANIQVRGQKASPRVCLNTARFCQDRLRTTPNGIHGCMAVFCTPQGECMLQALSVIRLISCLLLPFRHLHLRPATSCSCACVCVWLRRFVRTVRACVRLC